jgi:lysophospholipase L1-like esterase
MPSSTSSSKPGALFHAKLLAGICALLIFAFEFYSDFLLKHDSETYARVSRQYAEAVKMRPAKPGEPTSVLMIGNSLLLEGVDVDRLKKLTSSQMHVYPIFLEATGYYDWFYALQRLFREGAEPQVVVLGVGVNSFLADGVRQDYVPLMLFDMRDSLAVASDLKMDRTATSNLLLAHSSVFWNTRTVLRTEVLRHAVPHYTELVLLLRPQPAIPPPDQFQTTANSRLERLRELCEAHGAKLIILVPPTPSSEDAVRQMTLASRKAGVDTLVPIDPTALPVKYYQSDELHLNSEGAQLFTSALATFLPKTLDHEPLASPNQ